MPSTTVIRDVEPADREPMIAGYLALYTERPRDPSLGITLGSEPPTLESEHQWFDALMESLRVGRKVAQVAEVEGRVAGLCEVTRKGGFPSGDESHVGDLGLLIYEAYRGRGIGERLMRAVLERCRGRFEMITLAVFADNLRAKRVYEKLGFLRYGALPGAIKRGDRYIDSELMYLDLRVIGSSSPPKP